MCWQLQSMAPTGGSESAPLRAWGRHTLARIDSQGMKIHTRY